MTSLRITSVGNSLGVILTKELLSRLRVDKGDSVFVTETKNGIELSPYDPELSRQMDIAEEVMKDNRDVLRKLAE